MVSTGTLQLGECKVAIFSVLLQRFAVFWPIECYFIAINGVFWTIVFFFMVWTHCKSHHLDHLNSSLSARNEWTACPVTCGGGNAMRCAWLQSCHVGRSLIFTHFCSRCQAALYLHTSLEWWSTLWSLFETNVWLAVCDSFSSCCASQLTCGRDGDRKHRGATKNGQETLWYPTMRCWMCKEPSNIQPWKVSHASCSNPYSSRKCTWLERSQLPGTVLTLILSSIWWVFIPIEGGLLVGRMGRMGRMLQVWGSAAGSDPMCRS